MEDQERDMDPIKEDVQPIKTKTEKKKRLTIIVMGSVGKVRTFKVSPRGLWVIFILLLVYIPTSVIVTNNYFSLRRQYDVKSDEFAKQTKELSENVKKLQQSQEHEALLEDYVRSLTIPKSPSVVRRTPPPVRIDQQTSNPPSVQEQPLPEHPVDVQDLTIVKEGATITVDLKLVNNDPQERRIGGFVHLLAIADNVNPPQIWVYPREQLENGLPADFRKGELFIMKRLRPIRGNIYLVPDGEAPSKVKALIYDQSGEIIFEKVFEVPDES
ncbi:MAG: hypothetical protein JW932_05910 [Deltaproteobacteria bacterium]|nr:hypothetical protein [Deltaproteobacteria bacterium]